MSTSTTAVKPDFKPALWTPGDWNAFFGFGTNILVNMLVLTGLLRFVLKMPDSLVFGRILPALGLMMCLSTFYYAYLAYKLAQKTGRSDVCALPSGVSVPHMSGLTPKNAGDHSTRSASLPFSTEPISFETPWAIAGLMVYLAM